MLHAAAVKAGGKVVVELVGDVDPANGEAVIAYGWAMAEALADGLATPAADPRRPSASAPCGERGVELGAERVGIGDGQLAGEPLAHVRGGAAVERWAGRRGAA